MKISKEVLCKKQIIYKINGNLDREEMEKIDRIELVCEEEDNSEITGILCFLQESESKEEIKSIINRKTSCQSPFSSPSKSNKKINNKDDNGFSSPRPVRIFNNKSFFINVNNLI